MILIIDGDVLAYHACAPRWDRSEKTQIKYLNNEGGYSFTEEDQEYLERSWKRLLRVYEQLQNRFFSTETVCAVKGPNNFRSAVFDLYKANRKNSWKSDNTLEFVRLLREMMVEEDLAIPAVGCEADDLIRVWAEEARAKNREFVICSIDKDLKMIPGMHFNLKKETLEEVDPLRGTRFFYEQLLSGDPVDNIPGIPKIGPKKAEKALKDCTSEEEMQEVVVNAYIQAFGMDIWQEVLLANGKLLHLWRYPGDYFTFDDWKIIKEVS